MPYVPRNLDVSRGKERCGPRNLLEPRKGLTQRFGTLGRKEDCLEHKGGLLLCCAKIAQPDHFEERGVCFAGTRQRGAMVNREACVKKPLIAQADRALGARLYELTRPLQLLGLLERRGVEIGAMVSRTGANRGKGAIVALLNEEMGTLRAGGVEANVWLRPYYEISKGIGREGLLGQRPFGRGKKKDG
ncbi:hypothetical protein Tco_0425707 [Tanacetum coccineum]